KQALVANWGANMATNTFIAQQGAKALGLTDTEIDALQNVAGYAKTMEAMRRVGELNGEGRYVASGNSGGPKIMTQEAAQARRTELMNDTAWKARFLAGDAEAKREMTGLNTLITGSSQ